MGAKELSSYQDPHFLPWGRKEESRGAIMGVTNRGAHTNIHVGPRAQGPVQGRTLPQPWEEPLLGQVWPRIKGTAYH